jgi:hypothetical protein
MTFKVKDGISIAGTTFVDGSRNISIGTLNGNTPIHSGNYSSYALPLTGGAITGQTSISTKLYVGGATVSSGYNGVYASNMVGAASGNKLIYLYNDGTNIKLDAYDYGVGGSLSFNIGGNGGAVNIAGNLTQSGNQVLHVGNYGSYALPLSGGTVTGQVQLTADLQGNITPTLYVKGDIRTQRGTGNTGVIYFGNSGSTYLYYDGSNYYMPNGQLVVGGNTVLTTGNYSSYALPLSGGTLSGPLIVNAASGYPIQMTSNGRYQLWIKNTSASAQTQGWWLAHDSGGNLVVHADSNGDKVSIAASGFGLQVGVASTYDNPGGWAANVVASGTHHARVRVKGTSYNSSGDNEAFLWVDNTASPTRSGLYSSTAFNMNVAGGLYANGNQVLNSGNYNSYSPSLIGGGASGTWNINVTGSSSVSDVVKTSDVRTIAPSSHSAGRLTFGFTSWNNNNTADWADYLHLRSYTDSSGQLDNLVTFRKNGIGMRIWQQTWGSGTAYSSSVDVLHSSNYSSYALPLSGGTVAGPVTITGNDNQLIIDATTGATAGIFLRYSGSNKWEIYNSSTNNFGLYNYTSGATEFTISNSGGIANFRNTPTAGGNPILHAGNYTSYVNPKGGGWYGSGLPGSRWGGYSVSGGEISFGDGLPNAAQMGILVDGCYVAGENNGFWSMGSDNTWGSRRGMYWDGSYLNFTTNTPSARFQGILTDGRTNLFDSVIKQYLYVRHIEGKDWDTFSTGASGLYLNYASNQPVYIGGGAHIAIHAGNYTNYVQLPYAGWDSYPGKDANTVTGGSWMRSYFTYSNNAPLTGALVHFPAGGYDLQLNASYGDSAGRLAFRSRNGDAGSFLPWREVIHTGNYTSYSPSLTGSGASGTWGINVTGTAYGLDVHTGRNNEVNKVVRTDANGYIQAGWINTLSGDSGFESRLTRIYASNDGYLRYLPLTDFKVSMGLSAKNNYSRRIDYTSDANYHVGSFGHSGYGANETFHGGSGFFDIWSGTNYPPSTSHIHGFNALHYTVNSLGTTGSNAYGIQVAGQYDQGGLIFSRGCSGGSFSSWRRQIDDVNYSSYALPLSGGTLTGHLIINHQGNGSPSITVNNGGSENWRAISFRAAAGNDNFGIGYSNSSHSAMGRNNLSLHCGSGDSVRFHSDGWDTLWEVAGSTGDGWLKGRLGLGVLADLRLSVNGDSHISGVLHMGGTAGSYNSWGSRDYTTSGSRYINANYFEVNNYGYGSTWSLAVDNTSTRYKGNVILHAGNYSSYALPASGGTVGDLRTNFLSGGGGHSFGANHYSMGKDFADGGWSHPHYSDLIIGYHTGIRIGAAYSGIRFYNNSPTTDANNDGNGDGGEALLMTIGGHAGGSDVIINNGLRLSDGNLRLNQGSETSLRVTTAYGYLDLGPKNTSWCHLYSDRNIYTNVGIWINGSRVLDAGNYTSYSPSLGGSGASGTWGINITGTAGNTTVVSSSGYGNGTYTWRQEAGTFAGYSGWASYLINSHGDGASYYNQTIIMPFWAAPRYSRLEGGTFRGPYQFITEENISSFTYPVAARANRANGNFYIDDNYGNGVVGVYSSYRYQGVFAMGDSYKLSADGTSLGTLYGMAWSHPNTGGAAGNLTDHGLLIINNGSFRCAISNSIVASGNVTAYSDERLKTNWQPMPENYVTRLAQVKVGIYDRTDQENVTQVGVSAQSFQKLLPEAILTAKDEMQTLSVSYGNAALASSVELAKEVVDLRARVATLEALISKLIKE